LKDIFDSWRTLDEINGQIAVSPTTVVMFVTREKGEHVNMYHTLTDWYMAWQTLRVVKISASSVQVIILDGHSPGPLDSFWHQVIGKKLPMVRAAELEDPMVIPHAIWNPPGYSNILLGKKWKDCQKPMRMMEAFVADVDDAYQGAHNEDPEKISILYISRKPYRLEHVNHDFVGRQVDNEDEVIKALKEIKNVTVIVADFAKMSLTEQIAKSASADVMIGMHGAALSHSLWMPSWGSLVEMGSRHGLGVFFWKIAKWAGIHFENWVNTRYPSGFRKDSNGDYTTVTLESFLPQVNRAIDTARRRKLAAFKLDVDT